MYNGPAPDNSFDKYDEPKLHMERLLKARLVEFDLSIRILIPLESANIKTLGDLVKQSKKDLRKIRNLGRISVGYIDSFLSRQGLSLCRE